MKNKTAKIKNEMLRDKIKTSSKSEKKFTVVAISSRVEKVVTRMTDTFSSLPGLLA